MEEKFTPTVAVLIIKDKRVLLVRHKVAAEHPTGVYGLPSGRISEGESEEEAAVRELQEETGLTVQKENLIQFPNNLYHATLPRKDGSFVKFSWRVFLCKDYSGDLRGADETDPEWVEIVNLPKYNLLPNVQNAVNTGLEYLKVEL